jgi:hypothetical protein
MPIPIRDLLLICANLLPIGTYFCVIGFLHAAGRPLVTTSVRDFLALALALCGLVINGPLHYLLNSRMLPEFFSSSWWSGIALYALLVMALMPRSSGSLVIYNSPESSVITAVRTILYRLGSSFQEVPGGWILNDRGVLLELESFPPLNHMSLHFRGICDQELFRRVHSELSELLATTRTQLSPVGLVLAVAGGLVLALPIWMLARDPQNTAILFRHVLGT